MAQDVEESKDAAVRAFEDTSKLPCYKCAWFCRQVAQQVEEDKERIDQDINREAGKTIELARGKVGRIVLTFNTAAEEATRVHGEVLHPTFFPMPCASSLSVK